jgi:4-hydroxybutyrate CoA-transferase
MSWKDEYRKRLTRAEDAVRLIKSSNRITIGHCCAEPQHLVNAMLANKAAYENVEIMHGVPMSPGEYCRPENAGHFIINSFFVGGPTREAMHCGRAKYTPCFLSEIPRLFRDRILPIDIALCMVSSPDEHGYCSYGVSVDYTKPAVESAGIVIAQVNNNMPRTHGDCYIHVSEIDYIVEHDEPLFELQPPEIGPVERKIGDYCAELINDGACLQFGIGAIPNAIAESIKTKKDLGIHTEMFTDSIIDLIEEGIINGSRKNLHKGKAVATFIMGTKKLYDFVNDNPFIEMHTVDYTNDPCIIGEIDNMVSINSSLQVDVLGQAISEAIGIAQYSGVGGQVDFARGASRSQNGKSILAFPSTAQGGKISRIVPRIPDGAVVTTSRNDVQYMVTEYGIANLRGKSCGQRARELIAIAHPDFREQLTKEVNNRNFI